MLDTCLTTSIFKELSLEFELIVPLSKVDLGKINSLTGEVHILCCYPISTATGVSNDHLRLTGHKLIIHGLLIQSLEYTSNDHVEALHTLYFQRKFSTFITLPPSYKPNYKLRIVGEAGYIRYRQLSNRKLCSSVTLYLYAQ